MSTKTQNTTETVEIAKPTPKPAVQKVTAPRIRASDIKGRILKEGEFNFAKAYGKVAVGYVRVVKYEDTTIKVFDKDNFEVTPAKATICRAISILSDFDETELSNYSKRSTTRSAGARLLKLMSDAIKSVDELVIKSVAEDEA
jgi:hypothetical protein